MESRRNYRRYSKLSTEMKPTFFLGCQKIDYQANHCNTNTREKEIQEDLTVDGKINSYSCRTGIDCPKLRMDDEEEVEEEEKEEDVIYFL